MKLMSYAVLKKMMDQSPLIKAIVEDRARQIQKRFGGLFRRNRGYRILKRGK